MAFHQDGSSYDQYSPTHCIPILYSCGVYKHRQNFMYSVNPHGISYKGVYAPELSWLFTMMDPHMTNTHPPTHQLTHSLTHSENKENKRFLFMVHVLYQVSKFRNSLQQNTSIGYFRNAMIPFSVVLWNYRSIYISNLFQHTEPCLFHVTRTIPWAIPRQ